jgi:hypothetical protein
MQMLYPATVLAFMVLGIAQILMASCRSLEGQICPPKPRSPPATVRRAAQGPAVVLRSVHYEVVMFRVVNGWNKLQAARCLALAHVSKGRNKKWQNEPKFNFEQSQICSSRNPCRFRDP